MSELAERVLNGELRALSRVLTLLERGDTAAAEAMASLDPHTGSGYAVGITGPPGVGKSTLVDRLAEYLRGQGKTVGILAVDPTSPFTGGALLGDRIRMQRHYLDDGVFIRSVATRGQSGGLPRIVKSMVRALDAAGKDVTLVETVGVGQTELGIMGVADTVVVTMTPESGRLDTDAQGRRHGDRRSLCNQQGRPGRSQPALGGGDGDAAIVGLG